MDTNSHFIILGAGGHAKVVIDTLFITHPGCNISIRDDNHALTGQQLFGIPIQTPTESDNLSLGRLHAAIGSNAVRQKLFERFGKSGDSFATIIHPRATVAPTALIGEGSFIAAGAVIGPHAVIGKGCIINHNAIVDHDCKVGDYCHIAPNATLGGGACTSNHCFVGANATLLPGITIEDGVTVGAGSVVTKTILKNQTVIGIPARLLTPTEQDQ